MSRPMWFVRLIRAGFPHRFLAAKATRVPALGRLIEKALFEGDDLVVLPADRSIAVGEEVAPDAGFVMPSELVDAFIDRAGFLRVMDRCICRQSSNCADYPQDIGCLFMGEAARGINPRLGREVTRAEAHRHIQRAREAGLFHLIGRNRLDTVWLKVRPGDRLLTVCNCCPCCCLWKILPDVSDGIGSKVERIGGLVVEVTDACTGCGFCAGGPCLSGAIHVEGDRAVIGPGCRGCGHCAAACPNDAIRITLPEGDYLESLERRIAGSVDVS